MSPRLPEKHETWEHKRTLTCSQFSLIITITGLGVHYAGFEIDPGVVTPSPDINIPTPLILDIPDVSGRILHRRVILGGGD